MKSKLWRGIALVAAMLVSSTAGWAYATLKDSGGYVVTWAPGSITMQLKLGTAQNFTDGTSQASTVQQAMAAWNGVMGQVQFAAQAGAPGGYTDGNYVNEVLMADKISADEAFDENTLAITISYRVGNWRDESDITFNTAFTWDSYRGNLTDKEEMRRVAIHELGHVLGLTHPDLAGEPAGTTIMNSYETNIDALTSDDIAGAQSLYGAPGFAPANDNRANAIVVPADGGGTLTTNIGATAEAGEPNHAGQPARRSLWWKWTAPVACSGNVSTLGSNFDTVLAVYRQEGGGSLTGVAQNDNAGGGRTSALSFNAQAGVTYYIAVDGSDGYFGKLQFNLTRTSTNGISSYSLNLASPLTAGTTATVDCVVTNTGSKDWGANHYLVLKDNTGANVAFGSLSGTAVGASRSTSLSFTVPSVAGTYAYKVQAVENGVEWFGAEQTLWVTVVSSNVPTNDISYGANTLPAAVATGQPVFFDYTVTNSGTKAWGANHYLVLKDNTGTSISFVSLDGTAIGGSKTVNFGFTAPAVGNYTYSVQALENGVAWFGGVQSLPFSVTGSLPRFSLAQSQLDLCIVAGLNHTEVRLPITREAGVPASSLSADASVGWVTASVDATTSELVLNFATSALAAGNNNAIVNVRRSGEVPVPLQVRTVVSAANFTSLVDDPVRSRMYAVHRNGLALGAIAIFNPLSETYVGCTTVGNKPGKCVVSPDGSELLVINSAGKSITAIDLAQLKVKETIPLASYGEWGSSDTTADLQYGPGDILYYSDGSWAPVLRVFKRSTRTVLQTVTSIESTSYGFGDFAMNPAGTQLFAWGQYGWSAGSGGSVTGRWKIESDGTLTWLETGKQLNQLARDPMDTPVLVTATGDEVFMKQFRFVSGFVSQSTQAFAQPVYAISPNGEIVATSGGVYVAATGSQLAAFGATRNVVAITSDYARVVYFDATARQLKTLNLLQLVGSTVPDLNVYPGNDALVLPPAELHWVPQAGADRYRVYLGTSSTAVASATPASPQYLGETALPRITIPSTLAAGSYYWRVDPIVSSTVSTGAVLHFTVSSLSVSASRVDVSTVKGHARQYADVMLTSTVPNKAWSIASDKSWVSFSAASGTTPASVRILFDGSQAPLGLNQANVTITTDEGGLVLPVTFRVDPLALTVVRSLPNSTKVYAISEENAASYTGTSRAYLLEIDTLFKRIDRAIRVGTGATDLAVHLAEGRIYVPNWRAGSLLAIDRSTFSLQQTYAFPPFAGANNRDDVYRVAAGASGRVVIEAEDQWVNISIVNTADGAVLKSTEVREGGGASEPTGRYYYHGDNSTSVSQLHKFDTTGDVLTEVKAVINTGVSMYGDRMVLVSEDGQRVFWNGAVWNANLEFEWTPGEIINAVSADGRFAFSNSKAYDVDNRRILANLPAMTPGVSAFNSVTGQLVYQSGEVLGFYSLPNPQSLSRTPADRAIVLSPSQLQWAAVPGATAYRVYLGTSSTAVAAANTSSPLYLGEVSSPQIALGSVLTAGQTYFWRIDVVVGSEAGLASIQSFAVANVASAIPAIEAYTVRGASDYSVDLPLTAASPGTAWNAVANAAWVHLQQTSGTTPGTVRVTLDATTLTAGINEAAITLAAGGASVNIPVKLTVEPLALKALRAERGSGRVFAISEDTSQSEITSRAYLVEIDTSSERILRVVPAGRSATDLAIHSAEGRVYVANWRDGVVRAFDATTLEEVDDYAFTPFAGVGYSQTDAYQIAAGAAGRLMVEPADQSVRIALLNTETGEVIRTQFAQQGGGLYSPNGRYYYHGDSNSTGSFLHRYDMTGDVFNQTVGKYVLTTPAGYFGSRVVVMNEDGSRVFWNGGVFDATLNELWSTADAIYTVSGDGRYAFSDTKIYDTVQKKTVGTLSFPGSRSVFNPTAGKIVAQKGTQLVFATLENLMPTSNGLTYGAHTFPASAAPNSAVGFNFAVTNSGTRPWGANHYLVLKDHAGTNIAFASLSGVAAGGTTTVSFNFTTPTTAAIYNYKVQGLENGVEWFGTTQTLPLTVSASATPANAITLVSTTFPASAATGATVSFTYSVKNSGSKAWGANHYLVLKDNTGANIAFAPLSGTAANESKTVSFSFYAPATAGSFTYKVQALENGVEWFGPLQNLPLTTTGASQVNGITLSAGGLPTGGVGGSTVTFNYTVTNTGSKSWGSNHYLALKDNNGTSLAFASLAGTAPGAFKTVTFSLVLPATPGAYTYQFQAMEYGVEWFGAAQNFPFTVVSPAALNGIAFVSNTFPANATSSTMASFTCTVTNTGARNWGANHYLALKDNSGTSIAFATLDGTAVSGSKTVTFNFAVPAVGGTYTYSMQALENGVAWFGEVKSLPLSVALVLTPLNAITFGANTFPASVPAGTTVNFSYTVNNLGTKDWGSNHYLALKDNAGTNIAFASLAGTHGGASKTVNYTITAPSTAGSYTYSVQALEYGVEWFGSVSTLPLAVTTGPQDGISYEVTNFPAQVAVGATVSFNWVVKNSGGNTWGANHQLLVKDSAENTVASAQLGTTQPGDSKTVSFSFAAPAAGAHAYHMQAVSSGSPFGFAYPLNLTVGTVADLYSFSLDSTNLPYTVTPGMKYYFRYNVTNNGPTAWGGSAVTMTLKNSSNAVIASQSLNATNDPIPVGGSVSGYLPIDAPSTAGVYLLRFEGSVAGGTVFGQSEEFVLAVLDSNLSVPPQINVQPQSRTMGVDQNIVFAVEVEGTTPTTYQWQKLAAGSGTWTNVTEDFGVAGRTGTETSHLTLYRLLLGSVGDRYRCVITTPRGSDTTTPVTINMLPIGSTLTSSLTFNDVDSPPSVRTDGIIDITCNLTNTGTNSWGKDYILRVKASGGQVQARASVAYTPIGGKLDAYLHFLPPATPGIYTYRIEAAPSDGAAAFATQEITVLVNPTTSSSSGLTWRPLFEATRVGPFDVRPGQTVTLSFPVKNSGFIPWDATHRLLLRDEHGNILQEASLAGVAMGADYEVQYVVAMPVTPGNHLWMLSAWKDGTGQFSSTGYWGFQVSPNASDNQAFYTGETTFPTTATAGSTITFTYRVINNGFKAWGPNHYLALRTDDETNLAFASLDGTAVGQSKTVSFTFQVPAATGNRFFRLRGLEYGVEWFSVETGENLDVTP